MAIGDEGSGENNSEKREIDGTELPQRVVDEIARNADRILLPISSGVLQTGQSETIQVSLAVDTPRFYLLCLVVEPDSAQSLWVDELRVDQALVASGAPAVELAQRWRTLHRAAGSGSEITLRVSNLGAATSFIGGVLVAVTEDEPEV